MLPPLVYSVESNKGKPNYDEVSSQLRLGNVSPNFLVFSDRIGPSSHSYQYLQGVHASSTPPE